MLFLLLNGCLCASFLTAKVSEKVIIGWFSRRGEVYAVVLIFDTSQQKTNTHLLAVLCLRFGLGTVLYTHTEKLMIRVNGVDV